MTAHQTAPPRLPNNNEKKAELVKAFYQWQYTTRMIEDRLENIHREEAARMDRGESLETAETLKQWKHEKLIAGWTEEVVQLEQQLERVREVSTAMQRQFETYKVYICRSKKQFEVQFETSLKVKLVSLFDAMIALHSTSMQEQERQGAWSRNFNFKTLLLVVGSIAVASKFFPRH